MKTLFIALCFLTAWSHTCFGGELSFRFIGEKNEVLGQTDLDVPAGTSIGRATLHVLSVLQLPHEGEEEGLESVMGLGSKAVEQPDRNYKFYGWCYWVDGELANELTHERFLTGAEKTIVWRYSYAIQHQDRSWDMCLYDSVE